MDGMSDIRDLTGMLDMRQHAVVFSGTYSTVYKARVGEELVAVKVLRCVAKSMITMRRKVERERIVWAELNHPNIVPLLGYADDNMFFGSFGNLISPWYQRGDAAAYLEANVLTLEQRTNLYRNVVDGVCYLHTRNPVIIHGDLKPGNVLIDNQGVARLCDFGLARIMMDKGSSGLTTTSAHKGTDRYTPYELVVSQDAKYLTHASDVYSMACIGLVFLFLQPPYAELKDNKFGDISRAIRDETPPATIPAPISDEEVVLWNILETCLTHDLSARLSAPQVRERLQTESVPSNESIIAQRVAYLTSMLVLAFSFGTSDSNTNEPLKNMDTDNLLNKGRTNHVFYVSLAVDPVTQEPLSPAHCLHELRQSWNGRLRRSEFEEEEFIRYYNEYLQSLADVRIQYVWEWLIANLLRFGDKVDTTALVQKFNGIKMDLKAAVVLCGIACSSCGLLCIEQKSHKGHHDCKTNHRCTNSCSYIDQHVSEAPSCDKPAKHAGQHICKVLPHVCGAPCALKGRNGCKDICSKSTDHEDETHLCSAPSHDSASEGPRLIPATTRSSYKPTVSPFFDVSVSSVEDAPLALARSFEEDDTLNADSDLVIVNNRPGPPKPAKLASDSAEAITISYQPTRRRETPTPTDELSDLSEAISTPITTNGPNLQPPPHVTSSISTPSTEKDRASSLKSTTVDRPGLLTGLYRLVFRK